MSTPPHPDEPDSSTRAATDGELAFLARRQDGVVAEIQRRTIPFALILAVPISVIGAVYGGLILGIVVGVLVFLVVFGIGYAIAWSKREVLRVDARRGTVTIKRGPFDVVEEELRSTGRGSTYQVNRNYAYYAVFADERLQIDGEVGRRLLGVTPLRSSTVTLFRRSCQIVEVHGEVGQVVYRHPDFGPTVSPFRWSAEHLRSDGPAADAGEERA